jgi:hypothetical protein
MVGIRYNKGIHERKREIILLLMRIMRILDAMATWLSEFVRPFSHLHYNRQNEYRYFSRQERVQYLHYSPYYSVIFAS